MKDARRLASTAFAIICLASGALLASSAAALAAPEPPTAGDESVSDVGPSGATLHAQIDPGGDPTTYFFEYGTTVAYGSVTPVQSAGASSEPVSVVAAVNGLAAETAYHFRIVASSAAAAGPVTGPDYPFATFPERPPGLPDGRSYELVSPLENGDGTPLIGTPVRSAADGSAVAYTGSAPPAGGNGTAGSGLGFRPFGTNVYLAGRSGTGGWTAADIQPAGLSSAHYESLSSDLSIGILGSKQALVEGAPSGEDLYERNNSDGDYRLLAAQADYEGASADGSDILVKNAEGLWDSVGGQLHPVNVLPTGGSASSATFGSPSISGSPAGDLEHAISADGARVFWTAVEGVEVTTGPRTGEIEEQPKALYVRENASSPAASTVQLDVSEVPAGEGAQEQGEREARSGGGRFWGANSEGLQVFFTDENRLTSNSSAGPGAPDLYEYDFNRPVGERLVDLTAETETAGEHANVVGVLGTSENGAYVYFAAAGDLAHSGAASEECAPSNSASKCNIYVVHEGEAPRFVATVSVVDGEGNYNSIAVVIEQEISGQYIGDWVSDVGFRSAHVTPDGGRLVFESFENLTGFNPEGGREIYVYDFGAGLSCVSCNPTGESTVHGNPLGFAHAELPDSTDSTYALRDVSTDGDRVFFESNEALVAQDTSREVPVPLYTFGLTNVYEWEREGADESCPAKASKRVDGGCIFLLSDAASTDISFFVDASESGDDVFVETRAQLVAQDHDETFEVYDARVGAQELSPPTCPSSGCQATPEAPTVFATPASATITGVDDLEPPPPPATVKRKPTTVKCPKGKRPSHGKCAKPKKRKKAKARKSAHARQRVR